MNILPIAMIILVIVIMVLLLKISKRLITFVISGIVLLTVFGGAYVSYTQHITNPIDLIKYIATNSGHYVDKSSGDTPKTKAPDKSGQVPTDENDVKQQLLEYTNSQSSGPTKNYYWDAGPAKIQSSNVNVGDIRYSVDTEGRSSLAIGKLTYKMWKDSAGSRQGEPLDPPQGWPYNPKVAIKYEMTNRTYHGYMYNRSHSIADSLAGDKTYTDASNFTTGTRPQNVGANQKGGMRAAEILVEDYWKSNVDSTQYVDYQVLPVYNENETLPRGTIVDIKSSDGKLDKRLVIINDVEQYIINYNSGKFTRK